MPVIHFEFTANLAIDNQVKPFIAELHNALVEIIKTDLQTCRSVISRHENYVIGNGAEKNAFIQLSIRMLPGRDKATKDRLGKYLMDRVNQVFSEEINAHVTQTRVYLTEIDKDYYYGL